MIESSSIKIDFMISSIQWGIHNSYHTPLIPVQAYSPPVLRATMYTQSATTQNAKVQIHESTRLVICNFFNPIADNRTGALWYSLCMNRTQLACPVTHDVAEKVVKLRYNTPESIRDLVGAGVSAHQVNSYYAEFISPYIVQFLARAGRYHRKLDCQDEGETLASNTTAREFYERVVRAFADPALSKQTAEFYSTFMVLQTRTEDKNGTSWMEVVLGTPVEQGKEEQYRLMLRRAYSSSTVPLFAETIMDTPSIKGVLYFSPRINVPTTMGAYVRSTPVMPQFASIYSKVLRCIYAAGYTSGSATPYIDVDNSGAKILYGVLITDASDFPKVPASLPVDMERLGFYLHRPLLGRYKLAELKREADTVVFA